MNFREYADYIRCDLYRYDGEKGFIKFISTFFSVPGFKYTFYLRTQGYLRNRRVFLFPFYLVCRWLIRRCGIKYGIQIPYNSTIGPGLYIGHFGGIVVNYQVRIGKNCNINHGVTLGATYGGKHPGVPVIGNNVYLAPGCKIIGNIVVGNDVAVGANCVVTRSVKDKAIVVGIPGKIVSTDGSGDYVVNTV